MKWFLLMMMFSTPGANVTGKDATCITYKTLNDINHILECRPKFEAHHVWSLQNSTQIEFTRLPDCFGTLDELMADTNVAATMTIRAWCICRDDENKECPLAAEVSSSLINFRLCESSGRDDCRTQFAESLTTAANEKKRNAEEAAKKDTKSHGVGVAKPETTLPKTDEPVPREKAKVGSFSSTISMYPK
jgi:hypothetical protein